MNKQQGYINLDIPALITGCIIVGAVVGSVVTLMVPYMWAYVKPVLQVLVS